MDKLGKTNDFPRGKLNSDDEGSLRLAVGVNLEGNVLIIDFGTPVKWLGISKKQALKFANSIIEKCKELK
jgi:hypothetical protein